MRAYRSTLAGGISDTVKALAVSVIKDGNAIPIGSSCAHMFQGNTSIVDNVVIGKKVYGCQYMFNGCTSFNQNIQIGNVVNNVAGMFKNCTNLDQNIYLSNNVEDCHETFSGCTKLNIKIGIPNSVQRCDNMFNGCTSLNQYIEIPNSVYYCNNMFNGCSNLKIMPGIPASAIYCNEMLVNTDVGRVSDFYIPNGIYTVRQMLRNSSFNGNIYLPESVETCSGMLWDCQDFSGDVYIYRRSAVATSGLFSNLVNAQKRKAVHIYGGDWYYTNAVLHGILPNVNNQWTQLPDNIYNGYYNSLYNIYVYTNLYS